MAEIFEVFNANFMNIRNGDIVQVDLLIESYKAKRDLKCLIDIISFLKEADSSANEESVNIVDDVRRYIVDNLEKNESVRYIAQHFNYSYYYLLHIFKKHTATTLEDYIIRRKLIKSKILLKEESGEIIDVVSECGFENCSYFTEIFVREVGMSPSEYREKHNLIK